MINPNPSSYATSNLIAIQESSNQKSITITKSTKVTITLHSTYWSLESSGTLIAQGEPVVKPILPSPSAPETCKTAGMGCGTVTWRFIAKKTGTTEFVAKRTSCGESLRCTTEQGTFRVKFKVK